MADQSITRKQPTDVVLQQEASGAVAQHTQSQLAKIRTVARIGLAEADLTYHQLQAYLALDRRDEYAQQWLQDKAAHLLAGYEQAHNVVVQMAWQDIIKNRPEAIVRTVYAEDAAGRIQQLGALEFLCRPAIRDTVIPFSLHPAISDPDTGELQFPDPDQDHPLIAQIQQQLAARSGIPVTDILTEQERKSDFQTRLRQGTPQNPQQVQATTDAEGRQPPQLPDGTQPEPRSVWETQSRPTLNNDHVELLTYLMEHPDEPVSVVYKQVGMRAAAITTIRWELAAQGLLSELEVRTGSTTGGRPVKFLLPTTQAWELVGIEPPAGRGGAIHKHVQRMVVQGALAKGYSAVVGH